MEHNQRLVGSADAADFLQVHVQTLYQWRHKKTGPPSIRVGRAIRYRMADLERWLEQQTDPGDLEAS